VPVRFVLRPLDEIEATIGPEGMYAWFCLADGWCWIEIDDDTELFRYADRYVAYWAAEEPADWALPYVAYEVVRLWEDLLENMPYVQEPLHPTLARELAAPDAWDRWKPRIDRWACAFDLSGDSALFADATDWWAVQALHSGYLVEPPRIWMWREQDTIRLRWDNRYDATDLPEGPRWAAQEGEVAVPVAEFIAAMRSFSDRFLAEMAERVEVFLSTPRTVLPGYDFRHDQAERVAWAERMLSPSDPSDATDWTTVLRAIATLTARSPDEP
jgi:hypothetical protein